MSTLAQVVEVPVRYSIAAVTTAIRGAHQQAARNWTPLTKYNRKLIHTVTSVNDLHTGLGISGKGIKVAVLDSAVDNMNLALGRGFQTGFPGICVPEADCRGHMDNGLQVQHSTNISSGLAARCNYTLYSGSCVIFSKVESVPGTAGGNSPSLAGTNAC
ncbi:hypothetical protein HDU96_008679 [Phlyctochytrium bullatum]|nr:hypothetical protein HDU96_008679 [Phlyctochytrium bullatum]